MIGVILTIVSLVVVHSAAPLKCPGKSSREGAYIASISSTATAEQISQLVVNASSDFVEAVFESDDAELRKIGKLNVVYYPNLRVLTVSGASNSFLKSLRKQSIVESVQCDQIFSVSDSQKKSFKKDKNGEKNWGLDRITSNRKGLDDIYGYSNAKGVGVHNFVLDTGIYTNHEEFLTTSRVTKVDSAVGKDCLSSLPFTADDSNGHGTHVAGIIAGNSVGVAPNSTLHSVRVVNTKGLSTTSWLLCGLDYVISQKIAHQDWPSVATITVEGSKDPLVSASVTKALAAGVIVVSSAGNGQKKNGACSSVPARSDDSITVGASTKSDHVASLSNHGNCIDLYAPGSQIYSSYATSYRSLSGTSMAAAFVSGIVSIYLEKYPTATPAEVKTYILNDATPDILEGTPNKPNLLAYLSCTGTCCNAGQVASKETTCGKIGLTCDTVAYCDGINPECINYVPCRESAGPCDIPEFCPAAGGCPIDTFKEATVVCAWSGNDCQTSLTCSGSSASCPTAAACRLSEGPCDVDDFCTAQGQCTNDFVKQGTVCKEADPTNPCDRPDKCDGIKATCNDLIYISKDKHVCNKADSVCAKSSYCDDKGECSPIAPSATTKICRKAQHHDCDVAERCTLSSTECPKDLFNTEKEGKKCVVKNKKGVCRSGVCDLS